MILFKEFERVGRSWVVIWLASTLSAIVNAHHLMSKLANCIPALENLQDSKAFPLKGTIRGGNREEERSIVGRLASCAVSHWNKARQSARPHSAFPIDGTYPRRDESNPLHITMDDTLLTVHVIANSLPMPLASSPSAGGGKVT